MGAGRSFVIRHSCFAAYKATLNRIESSMFTRLRHFRLSSVLRPLPSAPCLPRATRRQIGPAKWIDLPVTAHYPKSNAKKRVSGFNRFGGNT
jgi:hypothetical protein